MESKIKDILSQIESKYKNKNIFPDSSGLWNGKAGEAIIYFILSKYTNNDFYLEKGFDLLDSLTENISGVKTVDFANGLSGIGWGIEWLVQNNFLEADTDDILEEIDDLLYKSVVYASDENISLENGTLGKIAYFIKRHQNINPAKNRYKNICHEECLIILTDEIENKLLGENGIFNADIKIGHSDNLLDIGHSLIFLSEILHLKINEPTVETTLYETIVFTDNLLKSYSNSAWNTSDSIDHQFHIQFLAVSYYIAGCNHNHSYWTKQSRGYLEKFSESFPNAKQLTLIGNLRQLTIYSLLYTLFPAPNYEAKIINILESQIKDNLQFQLDKDMNYLLPALLNLSKTPITGLSELICSTDIK